MARGWLPQLFPIPGARQNLEYNVLGQGVGFPQNPTVVQSGMVSGGGNKTHGTGLGEVAEKVA
jgi:hypothetical protein